MLEKWKLSIDNRGFAGEVCVCVVCECVSVCMCLFSSTVKASSDCKIFEIYLTDMDQRSYVVDIIPCASAKLLPLGI